MVRLMIVIYMYPIPTNMRVRNIPDNKYYPIMKVGKIYLHLRLY